MLNFKSEGSSIHQPSLCLPAGPMPLGYVNFYFIFFFLYRALRQQVVGLLLAGENRCQYVQQVWKTHICNHLCSAPFLIQGVFKYQHPKTCFCAVRLQPCQSPKCRFFWDRTRCCAGMSSLPLCNASVKVVLWENCMLMLLFSICRFPLLVKF